MVGDERIASREGGLLTKFLGGGWPDDAKVVEAIRARI